MSTIGVDAGTSMVKAVCFDEDWVAQATASVPTAVTAPRPGWSEQDLDEVWAAVRDVIRQVAPSDGQVSVVCVTAQGDGCWLVDPDHRPAGPALLWNDARATPMVDEWERSGLLEDAFLVTGSYGNAGLATPQLAWLRAHDDPRARTARTLLSCGSWVFHQLTGVLALHESDACNPLLDARTGEPAVDLLDRLGVGWVADLLPARVDGDGPVADLLSGVAEELGLRPGTPVVLAPYDVPATALGVGAVQPGAGFAVLGTTLCVGRMSDTPMLDRAPAGMSLRTGYPDRWLLAYATLAGTGVLEWARALLGLGSAADLVALAGTAGPHLPLVLPYLSPAGERAPFRDPNAAGAVLGLKFGHGPAELARGVLEGLSLTVRDCLLAGGQLPRTLAVCGGGARSAPWCQQLADVCGLPVTTSVEAEAGALGAALAGALAIGDLPELPDAAALVRPAAVFEPEPAATERYAILYQRWRDARLAGAFHAG